MLVRSRTVPPLPVSCLAAASVACLLSFGCAATETPTAPSDSEALPLAPAGLPPHWIQTTGVSHGFCGVDEVILFDIAVRFEVRVENDGAGGFHALVSVTRIGTGIGRDTGNVYRLRQTEQQDFYRAENSSFPWAIHFSRTSKVISPGGEDNLIISWQTLVTINPDGTVVVNDEIINNQCVG